MKNFENHDILEFFLKIPQYRIVKIENLKNISSMSWILIFGKILVTRDEN